LIFLRYIEVEQAWFQGLTIVVAEPLGIAVKVKPAIDTGNRYCTVLRAFEALAKRGGAKAIGDQVILADAVQVQIVLGVNVLQFRRDETVGPVQWQRDARCQVQTVTVRTVQAGYVFIESVRC
jgi:hypothetical protein